MDNKEMTRVAYNAIAKRYFEEYADDKSDLIYIDEFLENCNSKILDLGCGMGHYSKYMYNKEFKVVGVDFSSEMIKIARKNCPQINFIESDICFLPNNFDNDFDGILIAYVLQHLSYEEAKNVLTKCYDCINDSGNLLIFFRLGNNIVDEVEPFDERFCYTIKEYSINELTSLLNDCGFSVLKTVKKAEKDDEYSLCPTTVVLFAKKTLLE